MYDFGRVVEVALAAALLGGLLIATIVVGIPSYFIGRHCGKSAVYDEAIKNGVLEIRYDQKTGDKINVWIKNAKTTTDNSSKR